MTEEETQVQDADKVEQILDEAPETFTDEQKLDLLAVNVLQLIATMREFNDRLNAVEDYLGQDAEDEILESEGPSNVSH